jgi:di/tripeptidase
MMEILSSSDHIKNWCNWLNVKEKAISIGLKSVVIAIENGKIGNEEIKRGFLRAFFKAVCEYNFISHPELIPENFSVEKTDLR